VFTIGSLFSGYGGIEYGLERTGGFRTIWHSEIEPYPSAVLEERWPEAENLGDITKIDWGEVESPNILCGGFPCQDISVAGKRRGIIKGETRSGLWGEFHKAIRILRPRFVLIENVSALATLGLNIVLADLAQEGYDAEWLDIRASDFGAPHKRERIFIVAYPNTSSVGFDGRKHNRGERQVCSVEKWCYEEDKSERSGWKCGSCKACNDVPNTNSSNVERLWSSERDEKRQPESSSDGCFRKSWEVEPNVGRVVDGIARGLDSFVWKERIKALGNGVVPQITEWIGERIIYFHFSNKDVKP